MATTTTSPLMLVSKEEGVRDLPMKVRAPFAKALLAERNGDTAKAEEWLAAAIEAESRS